MFNYLDKLKPQETARHTFFDIVGEPTLVVKGANESNPRYFDAFLKRNVKNARRVRAGKLTRQLMDATREDDRELYARLVVVGWEGVKNDDGVDVPYSIDACHELISKLPVYMFDALRTFCQDVTNCLPENEEPLPSAEDVEDASGN